VYIRIGGSSRVGDQDKFPRLERFHPDVHSYVMPKREAFQPREEIFKRALGFFTSRVELERSPVVRLLVRICGVQQAELSAS
jgi:hypothetical protein